MLCSPAMWVYCLCLCPCPSVAKIITAIQSLGHDA
ncbi:hypothetical protein M758_6G108200 [Ceratodon purpureus]|nr:hypothetical protein M758_6G108200 [Ceratodon purpureus]